jgi:hypothetical protein
MMMNIEQILEAMISKVGFKTLMVILAFITAAMSSFAVTAYIFHSIEAGIVAFSGAWSLIVITAMLADPLMVPLHKRKQAYSVATLAFLGGAFLPFGWQYLTL